MPTLQMTIQSDETLRALSRLIGNDLPFASARALTWLAQSAQAAAQEHTREQFKLHTDFVPKGIGIIPARKSDMIAIGQGTSYVITKERISTFMPIHEFGGEREPVARVSGDKGKAIALPAKDLKAKSYQTSTGAVRQRYKPSELLKDYHRVGSRGGQVKQVIRGGRKGPPFIIRGRGSDVPLVVRRRGKKRYPLELLYIFSDRATYHPNWGFDEIVTAVVKDEYVAQFRKSYELELGG